MTMGDQTMNDDLLKEAMEFVGYVAGMECSHENFPVMDLAMSRASMLRQQADAIERRDGQIMRARALQRKFRP